jgi:hypothetical protein
MFTVAGGSPSTRTVDGEPRVSPLRQAANASFQSVHLAPSTGSNASATPYSPVAVTVASTAT